MYAYQVLQRQMSEEALGKHKIECRRRAAELRDEALFKDPPPKEDCPICFLPMPTRSICDYIIRTNQRFSRMGGLADKDMEEYFTCCGKSICGGCIHSFGKTGNNLTRVRFAIPTETKQRKSIEDFNEEGGDK